MKSKSVNYEKLYNLALSGITFCFLYLDINFLLPLGDMINLVGTCLGIWLLVLHILSKQRLLVILSLIATVSTIGYSIYTLFPFPVFM